MIYVFIGNEINILKEKINSLIKKLNINNIVKMDYSEIDIIDILNEINYIDLFNEKKLIIVSNFSFKKLKDKEEDLFINYINDMNDNILILKCVDENLDNRKNIIKVLKEKCKIEESKKMDYRNLHEYVTEIFKKNKINVTYNQVKKILELTENNVDLALNEVDKLLLYIMPSNKLTDEDILNVVSKNHEKEMFKLSDAVMQKNIGAIFDSYKILLSSSIDSTVIIDFLSKQFRTLYQVKVLFKDYSEDVIVKKLSINPYVIKKLINYINNYSEKEIIDILYKLSSVDIDIKINGLDKDKLLEIFFINI